MSSNPALGALIGLLVAAGVLAVAARWRRLRRPRLVDRARPASFRPARDPRPMGSLRLLIELATPLIPVLSKKGSGGGALEDRLAAAGQPADVTRYRLVQLAWLIGGLIAGGVLGLFVSITRGGAIVALLVFMAIGAIAALLVRDWVLSHQARRRARRMDEQLPTVAELLAFAVAAGEPPLAALERVSRTVDGELAHELNVVVTDVRVGTSMIDALRALGRRTRSAAVGRFVDGIVVSLERGTPLSDVLRAQAADARAASRRALMESAGKREVAMLVPVVFLILPIVVVIALFPGLYSITLSVP